HQRGHEQRGHDRAFDELARDVHWGPGFALAAGAETLTGPLGWTRNCPSTMTESPGLRSPVTATLLPSSNRTLTFCCAALESATRYTNEPSGPSLMASRGTTSAFGIVSSSTVTLTSSPGRKEKSLLSKVARSSRVPL